MLGFSKKKKAVEPQNQIDPTLDEQIHTMPERFYVDEKPKRRFSIFTLLIVLGVLVILGLGGFAVYLLYFNPAPVQQEQPSDTNVNINTDQSSDQTNTNVSIATSTDLSPTEGQVGTTTDQAATTTEEAVVELSQDLDLDGLTLAEEKLYQTDPDNPDSDGDSYNDGTEVLNGYDPVQASKSLVATGVFRKYTHPLYLINYPTTWKIQDQGADKPEVLFISATGEFIEVLVISNVNGLTLQDWYTQQFPERKINQATPVTINNTKGLISPDQKSYYLAVTNNPQYIFWITYNQGSFANPSFTNTYFSMVKTFFAQ